MARRQGPHVAHRETACVKVYPKKRKKRRPPFVVAYKAILRNPKLSLQCRTVFHILKSYANSDGTHCFPSIDRLCEDAGCPRRSMTRYLAELKTAGLIFGHRRTTKEKKLSSSTYLIYDDLHAKAAQKPRATRGARKVQDLAQGEPKKIVPFTEEIAAVI